MVNTQYLESAISANGMKKTFVADKMGLTLQGFSAKLASGRFNCDEAMQLSDILGIPMKDRARIFFAPNVEEGEHE